MGTAAVGWHRGDRVLVRIGTPVRGGSRLERISGLFLQERWIAQRPGWVTPAWWTCLVRQEVADLLDLPAGPQLIAALARLADGPCPADHGGGGIDGPPPGSAPGFPCACQVVATAAWQAVAAWAAVAAAGAVVAAAGGQEVVLPRAGAAPGVTDPAREELAIGMRTSPRSAASVIGHARILHAHPEAADLAAEGLLPLASVRRVCDEMARLDPADARAVAAEWAASVRGRAAQGRPMTGQAAVAAARRLVLAAPSHRDARERARAGRRVELLGNPDGTAELSAVLREEDAHRIHKRLTAMARGLDDPADPRSMDARRADLLVDCVLGRAVPEASTVEVRVTVPLAVLLGLRNGTADGIAEVAGLGPVPAEVARALAADGRWRAWITSADGSVLATTATTYTPPAALARLVRARNPHCRMPGCTRPAEECDLDHAVPWPDGPTSADNLGPLCRRHHILRTHYGYDLNAEDDTWRTPTGMEVDLAG